MRLLLLIDFGTMIWIIGYYTEILPVPKPTYYQFLTIALITLVQPVFIFITIRKNYKSSCHLKDALQIEFTQTVIIVNGPSYHTEIGWAKMFEIVELKHWFMMYQNNLSAIIIPKKSFSPEQENELKVLLKGLKDVPVKLKKEK